MSAIDEPSIAALAAPDADMARDRRLTIVRWVAIAAWAVVVGYRTATNGLAFNRELLLLYICTGLLAASIGRRRWLYVIRDWLPFALVLLVYDLSRGAANLVGTPTLWQIQIDVERWLFFGTVPYGAGATQAAQSAVVGSGDQHHLHVVLHPAVRRRGVLWLRNREEWKAFARLFVALNFTALVIYVVLPASPPWAAARCRAGDIEGGPSDAPCMFRRPISVPDGGILGAMHTAQPGANPVVERISTRGWAKLNLETATALIDKGQASVNMVAAIPSLHAALSAAIAVFLWRRVHRRWRPVLVAYVLIMASRWSTPPSITSSTSCSGGRWPRSSWSPSTVSSHVGYRQRRRMPTFR